MTYGRGDDDPVILVKCPGLVPGEFPSSLPSTLAKSVATLGFSAIINVLDISAARKKVLNNKSDAARTGKGALHLELNSYSPTPHACQ